MEPVGIGGMADGEWSSFNAMIYSSTEEADFMAQLLGNCSLPNDLPSNSNVELSSTYWPGSESSEVNMAAVEESSLYSSDETSADMYYCFSQGSTYTSGGSNTIAFPISSQQQHNHCPTNSSRFFMRNGGSVSTNYHMVEGQNKVNLSDHQMSTALMDGGDGFLNQDVSSDGMKSGENLPEAVSEGIDFQQGREHEEAILLAPKKSAEDKADNLSEISKKRPRTPLDVQKTKRMVKAKNNDQKLCSTGHNINDGEGSQSVLHRQSSSSCLSEDESNASHEFNGGVILPSCSNLKGDSAALDLNGKTRASRGSATDPQSLYARKRREKINERLRILQNLVPNGTKVDISTMLEEAVQYVKFLQLQIKLLSSDDLWMYAPIAYDGMNLGLDLKIDATLKS